MQIGQAYQEYLSLQEQDALETGCAVLIDQVFDDLKHIQQPQDLNSTMLESCLPRRYLLRYTPLFCKQFLVCIITVTWKLAQPHQIRLSSVAEELAAWAILEQSRAALELKTDESVAEQAYEDFIEVLFEDLDVEYLFDDAYDGIDEDPSGEMLGMMSLQFEDWFRPFSDESSYLAHPYISQEWQYRER